MVEGALGLKDLECFKKAFFAKVDWRLVSNPSSLLAQLLKAKYFIHCDFRNAKQRNRQQIGLASYGDMSIYLKYWM